MLHQWDAVPGRRSRPLDPLLDTASIFFGESNFDGDGLFDGTTADLDAASRATAQPALVPSISFAGLAFLGGLVFAFGSIGLVAR